MSNPDQSRINYRTDSDLKERLTRYAEAQGRRINDILDELVRARLDGVKDSDLAELAVGRELDRVEKQLAALTDESKPEACRDGRIIQRLMRSYETLGIDFVKIRLKAISDYRKKPKRWREVFEVDELEVDERELVAACQRARLIVELKGRKNELEAKLAEKYGIEMKSIDLRPVNPLEAPEQPPLQTKPSPASTLISEARSTEPKQESSRNQTVEDLDEEQEDDWNEGDYDEEEGWGEDIEA